MWSVKIRTKLAPFLKKSFPSKSSFQILLDGEKVLHGPAAKKAFKDCSLHVYLIHTQTFTSPCPLFFPLCFQLSFLSSLISATLSLARRLQALSFTVQVCYFCSLHRFRIATSKSFLVGQGTLQILILKRMFGQRLRKIWERRKRRVVPLLVFKNKLSSLYLHILLQIS